LGGERAPPSNGCARLSRPGLMRDERREQQMSAPLPKQ
jgi:hypothetical protein